MVKPITKKYDNDKLLRSSNHISAQTEKTKILMNHNLTKLKGFTRA